MTLQDIRDLIRQELAGFITRGQVTGSRMGGRAMLQASGLDGETHDNLEVIQPHGVSGLTGGTDAETDDALRSRVLLRKRQPPQGGAIPDYIAWARSVPGVTRAWALPLNRGAGTCDVMVTFDARSNPIPLPVDLAAVQLVLDTDRPVCASTYALAPAAVPLAVTIANLSPNTPTVQAAIAASLQSLVAAKAQVAGGATVDPNTGMITVNGGVLFLADISDAITQAGGVTSFDLIQPSADIAPPHGNLVTYAAPQFQ